MNRIKTACVSVEWQAWIDCPHCEHLFDASDDNDDDSQLSRPIFSNEWDKLLGAEITCPNCQQDIVIDEVD